MDTGPADRLQAGLTWAAPATCGELVQGFFRGRWLQIAAPVNLYRTARVEVAPPEPGHVGGSRRYAKVRQGLEILLREQPGRALRATLGGDEIPRGAGLGSSTADLGAALRAGAHSGTVWGLLYPESDTPAPEEVADILNRAGVAAVPVLPARSAAKVVSLKLIGGGCRVAPRAEMPLSSPIDARGPPEVRSETDAAPPL